MTALAQSPNGTTDAAPDENAPSADSLKEILGFDSVPATKYWSARWKRWVHLRGMTAREKQEWLREAVKEDEDGKRTAVIDHQQRAIARCWVTSKGEPIGEGQALVTAIGKLPPEALDELWEHVAELNALREKDSEKLKNSSAGVTGSGTSPDTPATTG